LDSATKQQVTWLVASVCSPPLRQAADTLYAILGQCVGQEGFIATFDKITEI